jgi:aminoglycoside 2'-N-acetyltransferase I
MSESISVTSAHTEELNADTRAAIIHVCRTAHQQDDFIHLFSYIPSGGIHVLAYYEQELVSHAVATTRWLQPHGLSILRTAYVDAVATLPAYQGRAIGSTVMRHLASLLSEYEIACLETDRVSFYARIGWEVWRGPLAGRKGDELVPTPDQKGIMILRLDRTPPLAIDGLLVVTYDGRMWCMARARASAPNTAL